MIPAPHAVTHIVRRRTGENALGQPVYSESATERRVYGWQPATQDERVIAAIAGRAITDVVMLTPDTDYASADRVVLDGKTYEVMGDAQDFTKGPFGFTPGCAVALRKVENA